MDKEPQLSDIAAIAYGGIDPDLRSVLAEFWIRSPQHDGTLVLGRRSPVLMHVDVVGDLAGMKQEIYGWLGGVGSPRDLYQPPDEPLPTWNKGPDVSAPGAYDCFVESLNCVHIRCDMAAAKFEVKLRALTHRGIEDPRLTHTAAYWVGVYAMDGLFDGASQALRMMEEAGISMTRKPRTL